MTEGKDAYYFSHDSNARNDLKIMKIRRTLGLEGYGIYFCLIEILRDQKDFCFQLDSLVDIAYSLGTSEEKIKTVVTAFDLFEVHENTFFSARLIRSMDKYKSLSQKRIEAGKKGGQASVKQRLSKGQSLLNDCSSIKGKKIKVKEKKLKEKIENKRFAPPTLSEVKQYVVDNNFSANADKFYKYYNEGNWTDSKGNKVRNWKQKLITWEEYDNGKDNRASKRQPVEKAKAKSGEEVRRPTTITFKD
jgi:hypothetical protein